MERHQAFPSVTILLVRHGQQQPDEGGLVGRLSPLSERGRLQAQRLAVELSAGPALAAVYSSPLARAVGTAEAICARLSLSPVLEPRLMEFELGTRRIEEIAERSDLLIWRPDDVGADGESLRSFSRRVATFLDEAVARHSNERIAVVAHAGTIDAAVRWALGIGEESPWQHEIEVQHASITQVELWPRGRVPGGPPRYATLSRVNHIGHLGELASDL
jgi:broad specificity phosphatase PhoE